MKYSIVLFLCYIGFNCYAQTKNFSKQELPITIENGQTTKHYEKDKLTHFTVEMYAVNYGNVLSFFKEQNKIIIKDAYQPNAIITLYLDQNLWTWNLSFKNKELITLRQINDDLMKLPASSTIVRQLEEGVISCYVRKINSLNFELFKDENLDKNMKLFQRILKNGDAKNLEVMFVSLADFFSKEDALLKIYKGSYADKMGAKTLGYLKTDADGKITSGINWQSSDGITGTYKLFHKGKLIESEEQNLEEYNKKLENFFNNQDEL